MSNKLVHVRFTTLHSIWGENTGRRIVFPLMLPFWTSLWLCHAIYEVRVIEQLQFIL